MADLEIKSERTFGETAFDILSDRLGRPPTASELIDYVQSEVKAQDFISPEVTEVQS